MPQKSRAYHQEEEKCPLCKSPSNLVIPVIPDYPKTLKGLTQIQGKLNSFQILKDIFLKNDQTYIQSETENFKAMATFYKKYESLIDEMSNKVFIFNTTFCEWSGQAAEKDSSYTAVDLTQFDVNSKLTQSLIYMANMSTFYGLADFYKNWALTYNLIFRALRLNIVKELSIKGFRDDFMAKVSEKFKGCFEQIKNVVHHEDEFVKCDIESLAFESLSAIILGCFDEVLLTEMLSETVKLFFKLKKAQIQLRHPEEEHQEKLQKIQNFSRKLLAFMMIIDYENMTGELRPQVEEMIKESLVGGEKELELQFEMIGVQWPEDSNAVEDILGFLYFDKEEKNDEGEMDVEEETKPEENEDEGKMDEEQENEENGEEGMVDKEEEKKERKVVPVNHSAEYFLEKFNHPLGFTLKTLHDNFADCYQQYLYSKCELCDKRPAKQDFGLCLICGYLGCVHACAGKENTPGTPGNMAIHNLKYHAGTSVFLNVMKGTYVLYENQRLFNYSGIYADQYGMTVAEAGHRADMSKIELSRQKLGQLGEMLLGHQLAAKIVQTGVLKNKVYTHGFY